MKHTNAYLLTRDIDWFFELNGKPVHVASAGGELPTVINDRDKLREIQHVVSTLADINTTDDIYINPKLVNRLRDNNIALDDYLQSFMEMAKKGFISVDRSNIGNPNDSMYHVVCVPVNLYSGDGLHLEKVRNEDFYINQETDLFDMSVLFDDILR